MTTRVEIPAKPPSTLGSDSARVASRVIKGAAWAAMTGQVVNSAALAMTAKGGDCLSLNDKINIPPVCHLCGSADRTKQKAIDNRLALGRVGGVEPDSKGRTRVELTIPICEGCRNLDVPSLVSIYEYSNDGTCWRLTLLVANRAVAEQYSSANPGTLLSRVGVLTEDTRRDVWGSVSPDGTRTIYATHDGDAWAVVENGSPGKAYEGILLRSPVVVLFSHDSRRVAYGALVGDQWVMVVDGVEGKPYDAILTTAIAFSPDGARLVYVARTSDKWTVVVEGVEAGTYDGILSRDPVILFSPDGQRTAYGIQVGPAWAVVVDGVASRSYETVQGASMTFSPDSRHLAYLARIGGKWVVVVDGTQLGSYEHAMSIPLAFSPDSMHIAYVTGNRDRMHGGIKWMLHYDGRECREVGPDGAIVFSPDSASVHYAIRPVVNGKPGARW